MVELVVALLEEADDATAFRVAYRRVRRAAKPWSDPSVVSELKRDSGQSLKRFMTDTSREVAECMSTDPLVAVAYRKTGSDGAPSRETFMKILSSIVYERMETGVKRLKRN